MKRWLMTGSKPAQNYCVPVPPKCSPPKPVFRMVNDKPFIFPDPKAPFILEHPVSHVFLKKLYFYQIFISLIF